MHPSAPGVLQALEASAVGDAIRQSTWIYPTANVAHILALAVFAGAVAVMDVRLLGGLKAIPAADVVRPARRAAIAAFVVLLLSGAVLFTAEASHVALNPVFQAKLALIAAGLFNAVVVAGLPLDRLAALPPGAPLPARFRFAAALSIGLWLAVAAAGRLIAYF
jgi:hypothetical protein